MHLSSHIFIPTFIFLQLLRRNPYRFFPQTHPEQLLPGQSILGTRYEKKNQTAYSIKTVTLSFLATFCVSLPLKRSPAPLRRVNTCSIESPGEQRRQEGWMMQGGEFL